MADISFDDLIPASKSPSPPGELSFDDLIPSGANAQSSGDASRGSLWDPVLQGLTMNFSDELAGAIGGVKSVVSGDTFSKGYESYRDAARANLDAYKKRHPWLATGAEVVGAIPTALIPLGEVAQGANLVAKVGRGALAGMGYGAVAGAGAGDDTLSGRVSGAASGAGSGAILGAAAPLATTAVRAAAKPVTDAIMARTNPAAFAAAKVAERLDTRGGVEVAANRIDNAATTGQNMSLADVGGRGVQKLARAVANVPGTAGDRIAAKTNLSTMAQGDRLKALVGDVFDAPEGAYQAAKATVMDARSTAAAPFYKAAYARPVPFTFELEDILKTPAGRSALATAKVNSANRREPFSQWFANVGDDGSILDFKRVPDTRALDETKRVLDRMVEAAKAPADGSPFAKAKATPQSIAIQTVRDDLVSFLDTHNPAYAKARSVGLDSISADDALEFGRNALNTDSRVIARKMGDPTAYGRDAVFNEGQRELARIGLAEALRDKIDKTGLTSNALLKFFATRNQVAKIRPFFATADEFANFRKAIFNEARKRKTADAIRGNSTTASQLAEMNNAGHLGEVHTAVAHAAAGKIGAAMGSIAKIITRLGGLTPTVANEIARLVMSADPATVRGIIGTIKRIEAKEKSKQVRQTKIRAFLTHLVAGRIGTALGSPANAQQAVQ